MCPQNTTPHKICAKCGESKPATIEYFSRRKSERDGLYYYCKECKAECARVYREANPEHIAESNRAWVEANPEAVRAKEQRRRARKRNAEGRHTAADIRAQYKAQRGRCYYAACGHSKLGKAYHVEHAIPLSRGGSNGPDNIVIACPTCNAAKGDKLPHEFPEGGRLL